MRTTSESAPQSRSNNANPKNLDSESLTVILDRWRSGDENAAFEIFRRYEQRLVELAQRRIGRGLKSRVQPESIALLVLESAFRQLREKPIEPDDSGSLWGWLSAITEFRILRKMEHHTAQTRDVRRTPQSVSDEPMPELRGSEPLPEEATILADELNEIRKRLSRDDFEILSAKLEGLSNPELAYRRKCARQTIRYKVERIEDFLRRRARSV